MLSDQARALLGVAARACGGRLDDDLYAASAGDREHAKAEPAAKIAITRVALASLAAHGHFGGKPDLVAGSGAVDRLQNQFKIEGELEFANHDDWRLAAA